MGIYLNPDNSKFEEAVNSDMYIDKTELIEYTNSVLHTMQHNVCVSRPRRFGKSLAANMLTAYYSRGCESGELFSKYKIAKSANFRKHLNQYNTIFLNIQEFLSRSSDIWNLIERIKKIVIRDLKRAYPNIAYFDDTDLVESMQDVYAETKCPFVVIIDEWDCIFREYKMEQDAQEIYLDFLRDLLKDKGYIYLAYMTGILPIKKYGTHSALNMFDEFSMINPGPLASYVGFIEDEVSGLCEKYGMDMGEVKSWYDGYSFGKDLSVYSPRSVVSCMRFRKIGNYWNQTETFEALKVYIDMNFDGLKDDILSMIAGENILVRTESFVNDMMTFRTKDDVLTLLIHLGYLAYTEEYDGFGTVRIPNKEVRIEFNKILRKGKHKELLRLIRMSDQLLEATILCNAELVANTIAKVHDSNYAPQFYNDEQALRSVVRYAYITCVDQYSKIEELPSGHGYADIVYLPKKKSTLPAMVIELKWNKTAEGALAQIKDRNYPAVLNHYSGELLLVAVNYDAKSKLHSCVIEKY